MRAVAVEAGATVGETFRALFDTWGVVVPLGEYPAIGMGGHVAGGAFGFLCRQLGLAADYLHARRGRHRGRSGTGAQRGGDPGDSRSASRSLVGAYRRRRRQLRGRHSLLVSIAGRIRRRTRPRFCPARRSRSRRSRRNGAGATSIGRPFCDSSGTTGPGPSGTAAPIRRSRRSGRCSRSIGGSSARSSSAA